MQKELLISLESSVLNTGGGPIECKKRRNSSSDRGPISLTTLYNTPYSIARRCSTRVVVAVNRRSENFRLRNARADYMVAGMDTAMVRLVAASSQASRLVYTVGLRPTWAEYWLAA